MKILNIHEAKTHFSKLIQRILLGEVIILARSGKPVAKLVPYDGVGESRKPGGSWQGKIRMAKDFDSLPQEVEDSFYAGINSHGIK